MRACDVLEISQGDTLNRISSDGDAMVVKVYSFDDKGSISISNNEYKKASLVENNMILMSMMSYKAKIANSYDVGDLIPSNYLTIKIKDNSQVDINYLYWYLSHSDEFKRELLKIEQGTIRRSIRIAEFRDLKLQLPSLEMQKKIGNISSLINEKENLVKRESELLRKALKTINREALDNGK